MLDNKALIVTLFILGVSDAVRDTRNPAQQGRIDICLPDAKCTANEEGELIGVPIFCHVYLRCSNSKFHIERCPSGEKFDPDSMICGKIRVQCKFCLSGGLSKEMQDAVLDFLDKTDSDDTDTTLATTLKPKEPIGGESNPCRENIQCNAMNDSLRIGVPGYCKFFFSCQGGKFRVISCEKDSSFDSSKGYCEDDSEAPLCQPDCTTGSLDSKLQVLLDEYLAGLLTTGISKEETTEATIELEPAHPDFYYNECLESLDLMKCPAFSDLRIFTQMPYKNALVIIKKISATDWCGIFEQVFRCAYQRTKNLCKQCYNKPAFHGLTIGNLIDSMRKFSDIIENLCTNQFKEFEEFRECFMNGQMDLFMGLITECKNLNKCHKEGHMLDCIIDQTKKYTKCNNKMIYEFKRFLIKAYEELSPIVCRYD